MNDPEAVRLRDGLARLKHPVDGGCHGQRASLVEDGAEIGPRQVLHHHVRKAAPQRAHVGDARDVLASDPRGSLRFPQESRDCVGTLRRIGQE